MASRFASSLLVVFFLTTAALPLTAGASAVSAAESELVTRGSILIRENANFTAENGVVSGTGRSGDPYIIEGWEMEFNNTGTGITVIGTSKYFVIRNVHITGAKMGVRFDQVLHGRVTASVIENCSLGVSASFSEVSRVDNNIIANCSIGVSLRSCDEFKVRDNTFIDNGEDLKVYALPWIETRQADLVFAITALSLFAFIVLLLYARYRGSRPPEERP